MQCYIQKRTSREDALAAIEATMQEGFVARASLKDIYMWEHSPSRTQMFWITLLDIPRGVSDHLVRHSAVGQQHFVKTSRYDRGGVGRVETTLASPTSHSMLVNAQHLIDMAKVRLCYKASEDTREVMLMIKDKLWDIDPYLYVYLVPKCVYRNGVCSEPKPCGKYKVSTYRPNLIMERITMGGQSNE